MADLNGEILVSVLTTAAAVTRQPLGKMMHVAADATFSPQYKEYTTAAALAADGDVGAIGKAAGATFFSQEVHPPQLLIGKYNSVNALDDELDLILAAITEAGDNFYVLTISERAQGEIELAAAWAAANDKFFVYRTGDTDVIDGVAANVMLNLEASSSPVAGIWHDVVTYGGEWPDVALAAYKIAANPDEKVVAWYDAQLVGVTPQTNEMTATQWTTVQGYNGGAYLRLMGSPAMGGGLLHDGKWIDEKITLDWLGTRIREDIAQLRLDISKLQELLDPYNGGLGKIFEVLSKRVETAESIGHIAPGRTEIVLPEPEEITDRNAVITINGVMHGGIKTFSLTVRLV